MSDENTVPRKPISLVISDASLMRCELLSKQLIRKQPRIQVIGHAVGIAELIAVAHKLPDIVVVSGALVEGPLAGFGALERILEISPKTRNIVLLDRCDQDLVVSAFRGGARGVFCRSGELDGLLKCIESVYVGQIWANSAELEYVLGALNSYAPLKAPKLEKSLNRREERIVTLVSAGETPREIGRKLNLTEQAVERGVARLCSRIGVHSRVELAMALAQQQVRAKALTVDSPASVCSDFGNQSTDFPKPGC